MSKLRIVKKEAAMDAAKTVDMLEPGDFAISIHDSNNMILRVNGGVVQLSALHAGVQALNYFRSQAYRRVDVEIHYEVCR